MKLSNHLQMCLRIEPPCQQARVVPKRILEYLDFHDQFYFDSMFASSFSPDFTKPKLGVGCPLYKISFLDWFNQERSKTI